MSRSRHTDPLSVRAPRRVLDPRATRGSGDRRALQDISRSLKRLGFLGGLQAAARSAAVWSLPRVTERAARPGFLHPARRREVMELLRRLGPEVCYGLRGIDLVQSGVPSGHIDLRFGNLRVPGRIFLFEQPQTPWQLPGRLPSVMQERLLEYGAQIEGAGDGAPTLVHWPGDTMREFVLFAVLAHELGHHLLQHHKGKRLPRVVRSAEHEAWAEAFAARCRADLARKSSEQA